MSHCDIIELVGLNIGAELHGEPVVLIGCVYDAYLGGLGIPEIVDLFLLLLFLDFLVGSVKEL